MRTTVVVAALAVLALAVPARGEDPAAGPAPGDPIRVGDTTVIAPPPGTGVFAEAIVANGPLRTMAVETDGLGVVRIREEHDEHKGFATPLYNETLDLVEGVAACLNDPYTLFGWRESKLHRWRFNAGSSPSYLHPNDVRDALIRGTNDVTETRNICQMPTRATMRHRYDGTTTRNANISNSASCGTRDERSVVSFGTLPSHYVAYACIWYSLSSKPYPVLESDIKFNKRDFTWFWLRPLGCENQWDIESVMAHERGHTFGLGHVDDSSMTMSQYIRPCSTSKRMLGRGDVVGLEALYA